MARGWDYTCDFVRRACHEEFERMILRRIDFVAGWVERVDLQAVDERARVNFSVGVDEMDLGWGREGQVAILGGEIVWRDEAGEENERVKNRQQDYREPKFVPGHHAVTPFESWDRRLTAKRLPANFRLPRKK